LRRRRCHSRSCCCGVGFGFRRLFTVSIFPTPISLSLPAWALGQRQHRVGPTRWLRFCCKPNAARTGRDRGTGRAATDFFFFEEQESLEHWLG
jgi:hypothetical protein